jgi:hypothetical protein
MPPTIYPPGVFRSRRPRRYGEIAGTWRPRKNGRRLTLAVTTFRPLPPGKQKLLRDEAEQLAPLRGASSVAVELDR